MKIHELQSPYKRPKRKRVGRGMRSGCGKTSSRGNNGQGQRSGPEKKPGFEGGQMPLYRRVPKKKHFFNPNRRNYAVVNVGRLNQLFKAGEEVTLAALVDKRVFTAGMDGLRVLGNGELQVKLQIKANYVSPSAQTKIESQGGQVELLS